MEKYYPDWVRNRCTFITEHFGKEFFQGKKILELGSFESDIGAYFSALGANVTCYEGRQSNIDIAKLNYPHLDIVLYNIEDLVLQVHYDIILNMGILYHLKNVDNCIEQCLQHSDYCVLESEVVDNELEIISLDSQDRDYKDQSCSESKNVKLVSEAYLEDSFKKHGATYTKHNDQRLNGDGHKYDWKNKNSNKHFTQLRRFYFIETHQPH